MHYTDKHHSIAWNTQNRNSFKLQQFQKKKVKYDRFLSFFPAKLTCPFYVSQKIIQLMQFELYME